MLPPSRTIVGFDFSPGARHALAHARAWAKSAGGSVTLVHALPAPYEIGLPAPAIAAGGDAGEQNAAARAKLDALVKELAAGGVVARARTAYGSPVAVLLEAADREKADLIVVGPNRSGLRRALLGSVAETVAREARQPVLVVRGAAVDVRRPIVAGVDGSGHSKRAFRAACSLGAAFGARVLAAHALPAFLESRSHRDDATAAQRAARRDQARYLARLVRGTNAKALPLEGEPADALLRAARDENASLLVLARRGRSTFEQMLLGSVVGRVLRRTTVPLLVTPRA